MAGKALNMVGKKSTGKKKGKKGLKKSGGGASTRAHRPKWAKGVKYKRAGKWA